MKEEMAKKKKKEAINMSVPEGCFGGVLGDKLGFTW